MSKNKQEIASMGDCALCKRLGKQEAATEHLWIVGKKTPYCNGCADHMRNTLPATGKVRNVQEVKKWLIAYFNAQGEVATPVWTVESKIKPTRWAKQGFPGWNLTFKIKQVDEFSDEGYKDSYVKSW